MRKILLAICLIICFTDTYSQVCKARKTSRSENQYVYKGGVIKIFSGQRIQVATSNTDGRLKGMRLKDSSRSQITDFRNMSSIIEQHNAVQNICIDLNVIKPENSDSITVLLIKNPYKKRLYYKARIYSPVKKKFVRAHVLPVVPGLSGVITWPYPVSAIIINKLKVRFD
jgi:hypothetical protein